MNSVLLNLITFLAGLLVGNRLAIGRDKRKEFNETAQLMRAWLLNELEHPNPYTPQPDIAQIDDFVSQLPFWKRSGFRKWYKRQNCARQDAQAQNSYGEVFYKDDNHIKECLKALLPYTKRR